jgi:hypothetical protein
MGLSYWSTHLLASYAKNNSLGETLTLGRQNITIPERFRKKLSLNHELKSSILSGFCEPLLVKLGATSVNSLDVSNYESCDLTLDLSQPVPKEYWNRFDTVLDYGTSEHIFNFPQVLSNVFMMLKNNGAYNFCLPVTGWCDHGLYQFSPNMFTSIAASGYFDLKYLFMQGGNVQRRVYAAKGFVGLRSIELLSHKKILAWGILTKNKEATLKEELINVFQIYYLKSWEQAQSNNNNLKKYTDSAHGALSSIDTGNINLLLKKYIPEKIKQMLWFYKAYRSLSFDDVDKNFDSYMVQYDL